jgi:nitrogen fixation/metabolism regulation signal transduction histidine kinase
MADKVPIAAEPADGIRETGHTRKRSRAGHCRYAYAQGFCGRNFPTTSRASRATVSGYQQVILNLLQNASDAMSAVDDRPRQLLIRTERDERDLEWRAVRSVDRN